MRSKIYFFIYMLFCNACTNQINVLEKNEHSENSNPFPIEPILILSSLNYQDVTMGETISLDIETNNDDEIESIHVLIVESGKPYDNETDVYYPSDDYFTGYNSYIMPAFKAGEWDYVAYAITKSNKKIYSNRVSIRVIYPDITFIQEDRESPFMSEMDAAWDEMLASSNAKDHCRREMGFIIYMTVSDIIGEDVTFYAGDLVYGRTNCSCSLPPNVTVTIDDEIIMGPDLPGRYAIAWFHTHLVNDCCGGGRNVGASNEDEMEAAKKELPGLVYDYVPTFGGIVGGYTDRNAEHVIYVFGPKRRTFK